MSKLTPRKLKNLKATTATLRESHSQNPNGKTHPAFNFFLHCEDDVIVNVQIESLQNPIKNIIKSPV